MRPARRAALLVLLASPAACAGDRVFECEEDGQCALDGVAGRCEPSGYCSLPDGACPDGYRYVDEAPEPLAGTCVGADPGCTEEPCEGCAVAVATGARHTCAIVEQGAVYCWGDNGDLQLGSSGASSAAPRQVAGVSAVEQIAAGDRHSCAALSDRVVCWGANDRGQLGTGATGAGALPGDRVVDSEVARALSAGGGHTCATDDEETVWCWGDNQDGQVAPGAGDTVTFPDDPLGLFDCAVAIAAGGRHSAALLDDGSIVTWGEADAPFLGRGDPTPGEPYMIIVDWFEPAAITAGGEHTCGIGIDRAVRCWGVAADGRLGVDGADRFSPAEVGIDADLIRAGGRHTCAIDGGELVCWGANHAGQLGAAGESGAEKRPVAGSWTAVAAGGEHTCAIASDRTVHCWGGNGDGQLGREGDGSSEPSQVPLRCP